MPKSGRKVSLIGWSLGGVYARLLASTRPELVRSVITLGSPFTGSARATNAWRVYEGVSGQSSEDPRRMKHVRPTPPVPTTSIFSRSDGVVAWQCSVEETGPQSENIEVVASHLGLGAHPAVLYALADRLAQPEGEWKPFNRGALGPLVYPDPARAHDTRFRNLVGVVGRCALCRPTSPAASRLPCADRLKRALQGRPKGRCSGVDRPRRLPGVPSNDRRALQVPAQTSST